MKKKILLPILILLGLLACAPFASASGDYVAPAKFTDVVTYINNYPIPSYNLNGYTFVKAEDLRNYGFDITWTEADNSIRIMRNDSNVIDFILTCKSRPSQVGKTQFNFVTTDTKAYVGNYNYQIEALGGIPGYTLINVDNLKPFAEIQWIGESQQLHIWIRDGLQMSGEPLYVPYDYSDIPSTEYNCKDSQHYFSAYFNSVNELSFAFATADIVNNEVASYSKCRGMFYVKLIDKATGNEVYSEGKPFDVWDYTTIPYYISDYMDIPYSVEVNVPKWNIAENSGTLTAQLYYWCDNCNYGLDAEYEIYL
jgi:hypothetical protein